MPKADNKEWPTDRLDSLRLLAKDGYSAREIVDRLWATGFKTTRNAVIGKARRCNVELSHKCAGYLSSQRQGRKGKPKNPLYDYPPRTPIPARGLCQWPMGEVWCGCVVNDGPYCDAHKLRAYTGEIALTVSEIERYL